MLSEQGISVIIADAADTRPTLVHVGDAGVSIVVAEASLLAQRSSTFVRAYSERSIAVVAIIRPLDAVDLLELLDMGVRGLLAASEPPEELVRAVHATCTGGLYVSARFCDAVVDTCVSCRRALLNRRYALSLLTEREREVFHHVVEGRSDAEIAQRLHISVRTARFHVSNILSKLGYRSRMGLVTFMHQ